MYSWRELVMRYYWTSGWIFHDAQRSEIFSFREFNNIAWPTRVKNTPLFIVILTRHVLKSIEWNKGFLLLYFVILVYSKRLKMLYTGCCKTTGKLWQHITETLYGVFLVFLGSFDCQIWAIFHFGTLWAYGWKKSWKIWPWKKARFQGWLKLANFLIS